MSRYIFTKDLEFPDTLQIGRRLWKVQQPFIVDNVLIPEGFETDYGSIPRVFWSLIEPQGLEAAEFIYHDFTYATELFERKVCDWKLLEGLEYLGDSWLYRNTVYSNVRTWGWLFAWRKHTKESINKNLELWRLTHYEMMKADNKYGIEYRNGVYKKNV